MSARYELAVQEAFFWGEHLDNGGTFADYGVVPTPGITASLSGLWRGRNKADNEASNSPSTKVPTEAERHQREESRRRYGR